MHACMQPSRAESSASSSIKGMQGRGIVVGSTILVLRLSTFSNAPIWLYCCSDLAPIWLYLAPIWLRFGSDLAATWLYLAATWLGWGS